MPSVDTPSAVQILRNRSFHLLFSSSSGSHIACQYYWTIVQQASNDLGVIDRYHVSVDIGRRNFFIFETIIFCAIFRFNNFLKSLNINLFFWQIANCLETFFLLNVSENFLMNKIRLMKFSPAISFKIEAFVA